MSDYVLLNTEFTLLLKTKLGVFMLYGTCGLYTPCNENNIFYLRAFVGLLYTVSVNMPLMQ